MTCHEERWQLWGVQAERDVECRGKCKHRCEGWITDKRCCGVLWLGKLKNWVGWGTVECSNELVWVWRDMGKYVLDMMIWYVYEEWHAPAPIHLKGRRGMGWWRMMGGAENKKGSYSVWYMDKLEEVGGVKVTGGGARVAVLDNSGESCVTGWWVWVFQS